MAQATLDAFMTKPKDPLDPDAAMEVEGKHEDAPTAPKGVPRLRVAGTSTVLGGDRNGARGAARAGGLCRAW